MRNLVIGSIILLTMALIYGAIAQVDLSGAKGEAVLNEINTPGLTINTSANVALGVVCRDFCNLELPCIPTYSISIHR